MRRLLMLIAALSALLPCVAAAKDQPLRRRAGANLVTLRLSDENAAVAPDENAVIPQEIQSEDIKGFDDDLGIPPKPDDPKGEPVQEEDTPPILAPEEIPSGKPSYNADDDSGDLSPDDEFFPMAGVDEPPPDAAKTCSSGEWIDGAGRYLQIDFSYMTRIGPQDFVAAQTFSDPPTELASSESLGFAPGLRLTAGRFLCRDGKNRDHKLEATFLGGHSWLDQRGVSIFNSQTQGLLFSNFDFNAFGFNQSTSQRYEYRSDFNSFELNWRVSKRMGRDRMELRRNGCWVRKCSPGPLSSFIAGIRTVGIDEEFNYFAQGANATTNNGAYRIQTQNDMLGLQLGAETFWQHCRWRAGARGKVGPYINWAEQDSQVEAVLNANRVSRDETANSNHLAFFGEVNLFGAYQLRHNLALVAQYDLMWANQIALAPEQVTFVRNPPGIVNGGSLFYQGMNLGLEMSW